MAEISPSKKRKRDDEQNKAEPEKGKEKEKEKMQEHSPTAKVPKRMVLINIADPDEGCNEAEILKSMLVPEQAIQEVLPETGKTIRLHLLQYQRTLGEPDSEPGRLIGQSDEEYKKSRAFVEWKEDMKSKEVSLHFLDMVESAALGGSGVREEKVSGVKFVDDHKVIYSHKYQICEIFNFTLPPEDGDCY